MGAAAVWSVLADRRAEAWYQGDRTVQVALARGVAEQVMARGGDAGVSTGSDRFDGEWDLVTCQMAVIGLAQVALEHPDTEAETRPARDRCLDWLVTPEARRFGTAAWGTDAMEQLQTEPGHAYLGYVNLALALDALVRPDGVDNPHEAHLDAISEGFLRWMDRPVRELRTYPGETYPPDQATVLASLVVRARARNEPWPTGLPHFVYRFGHAARDPDTGWIRQSISPADGTAVYGVRGSGTAFTAAWMAWVDPTLSRELFAAHRDQGLRGFAGFGGMREYPPGVSGWGDIDSGPVLFGVGVSPTGFALASARAHRDPETHRRLYRTAHLFGLPVRGGRRFLTGGGIGNALMLAMLTAPQLPEPP